MSEVLHIAFIKEHPLYLRKTSDTTYEWQDSDERALIFASSVEEACRLLKRRFKDESSFRYLLAGKRFTLPERDEHGSPALFHHLKESQKTPNGIYFDQEFGCSSQVREASQEAIKLTRKQ